MNQNLIMFLFAILILLIGAGAGVGINYLTKKGKDPKMLLDTADTMIDGLNTANTSFGGLLPMPVELIIDKILKAAQSGVHAAQQLYNDNQLAEDERKQKAFGSAMNLLKIEGYAPTPELEAAVKDAIEAGVFVMKNIGAAVTPVSSTAIMTPDSVVMATDPLVSDIVTETVNVPTGATTSDVISPTLQPIVAAAVVAYNQVLTDAGVELSAQAK